MRRLTDLSAQAAAGIGKLAHRGSSELHYLVKMLRAGALRVEDPRYIAAMLADMVKFGNYGVIPGINARRTPDRLAVVDDFGDLTYRDLERSVNAVANGLRAKGVLAGDGVAVLARNHRWFVIAMFGAARAGARTILLNTDFSGPQIAEVCKREGVRLVIHDAEYAGVIAGVDAPLGRLRALDFNPDAPEAVAATGTQTLAELIAGSSTAKPPKPARLPILIILTSGTTGSPKGASRHTPPSLSPLGGILSRTPFRQEEVTVLPAPLFHGLGYVHCLLALTVGSTLVLRRKFDPARVLADIEQHRATALIVVPVMLNRILGALEAASSKPDLSSLRIAFVSGSQLGAELASRALRELGPVVYNMYGSTEISYVSIADPDDLSANPATVGRVVTGVRVRILDEHDRDVAPGEVGRIFVGTFFPFEGYTGGGGKTVVDGLMASGDVGYFDADGLLFVSGRDDEMIVSGGENVFPAEIEDLISGHPEVVEAAAMGVEDTDWGERLRAYVVKTPDATIDEEAIKTYVRDNLARYKVPRDVIFLDELPRNPAGKVLKRELRG